MSYHLYMLVLVNEIFDYYLITIGLVKHDYNIHIGILIWVTETLDLMNMIAILFMLSVSMAKYIIPNQNKYKQQSAILKPIPKFLILASMPVFRFF
jgi:hypothetical protein